METEKNASMPLGEEQMALLTVLPDEQRALAMERFAAVRLVVEGGLPQAQVAREHCIPLRTLEQWLALYRKSGLVGLAHFIKLDRGTQRSLTTKQIRLIEGLTLQKPKPSIATVHRKAKALAKMQGWSPPSYEQVIQIVKQLDSDLLLQTPEGKNAIPKTREVDVRPEVDHPNALWQAGHTLLNIWLLNEQGKSARPWLSIILDVYSRCVAGYLIGFQKPSTLHTALMLRQAIWRKEDPRWHIYGIPEQFATDHSSDVTTSMPLELVAANLKIALQFSWTTLPQSQSKMQSFFSTVNQRLLVDLPGYAASGQHNSAAVLDLSAFERRFRSWLLSEYQVHLHEETRQAPQERWEAGGFLPQMPSSLEDLDALLLTVRKPRRVHQDGISFQGQRYVDTTLGAYNGEDVFLRYDPADMAEIRLYFRGAFLCRAICVELAGKQVSLKEIIQARTRKRKQHQTLLQDQTPTIESGSGHGTVPSELETLFTPQSLPEPRHSSSQLKRYLNE